MRIVAPIPIIRTKLVRFVLFELTSAAGVVERCVGSSVGDAADRGAVLKKKILLHSLFLFGSGGGFFLFFLVTSNTNWSGIITSP